MHTEVSGSCTGNSNVSSAFAVPVVVGDTSFTRRRQSRTLERPARSSSEARPAAAAAAGTESRRHRLVRAPEVRAPNHVQVGAPLARSRSEFPAPPRSTSEPDMVALSCAMCGEQTPRAEREDVVGDTLKTARSAEVNGLGAERAQPDPLGGLRSRLLPYVVLNDEDALLQALRKLERPHHPSAVMPRVGKSAAIDTEELDGALRFQLRRLLAEYLSQDGRSVDYRSLSASTEFADFLKHTASLRHVNVFAMNTQRRLAFFLNTYNVLLIHAVAVLGKPQNFLGRFRFYCTAAYRIGGYVYSLNDIENGVLRGNRPAPYPFARKPFREDGRDGRARAVIAGGEPLIHFGLNCGARSCPPIRYYNEENVEEALQQSASSFIRDNVVVFDDGRVQLSRIFLWYAPDFGDDVVSWLLTHWPDDTPQDLETRRQLEHRAQSGRLRLTYAPYDWSWNQA
ncbi:hypothetical protein CDCA_CDCA11G3191 [Cyanidium caldarium]|uniref:DUF547 domain-containing protein n=1 Tax=Cyanidium caldarium TaxID=2771 RepID=A0AAV9IYF5_CYACA|nr:hypothetical protein CDCA_CDCA11G3191 [Cyanidium caldarium]|eukprot:ctg_1679.g378